MADIFISYDSADRETADAIARMCRAHGWSVWWDRDIQPGSKFPREDCGESSIGALRRRFVVAALDCVTAGTENWVKAVDTRTGASADAVAIDETLYDSVTMDAGARFVAGEFRGSGRTDSGRAAHRSASLRQEPLPESRGGRDSALGARWGSVLFAQPGISLDSSAARRAFGSRVPRR
jgi:hypothetical protein